MEGASQRKTDDSGPKSPRSPKGSPRSKDDRSKEELEKIEETRKKAKNAIKKKQQKNSITNYSYHIVIGSFVVICVVALISTFFGGTKKLSLIPVIDEDEITTHNQQDHTFSIGKNDFFEVFFSFHSLIFYFIKTLLLGMDAFRCQIYY